MSNPSSKDESLDIQQAFDMLEACGVPRERARSVRNGIQVLDTRYAKQVGELRRMLAAAEAAIRELSKPDETNGELRNWYAHDGIKVHLLTSMDRETALKSLRTEMPDAYDSDLKPCGGRAHMIFNSSPPQVKTSCSGSEGA